MTAVALPIRGFEGAKTRLAGRLSEAERAALLQELAERVVRAAGGRPVLVVTSAPEVEKWAVDLDLPSIPDPGSLGTAAAEARDVLAGQGHGRVVVAHADLPDLDTLDAFDVDDAATAVIGRSQHGGTPVLSVPTAVPFRFHYGEGSFALHVREAQERGLAVREVAVRDLDTPDDL